MQVEDMPPPARGWPTIGRTGVFGLHIRNFGND